MRAGRSPASSRRTADELELEPLLPGSVDPVDSIDEGADDTPRPGVCPCPLLEWPHAKHEAVGENVDLQFEDVAVHGWGNGRSGQGELVDPVDRKIEPRAQSTENERDDPRAARAGGNGEENRVRHATVAGRADPTNPSTLLAVPEADLSLSTETTEGVRVTRVVGELDLSTVAAFDAELDRSSSAGRQVVVLAECTFIDSSALRSLVRAQRRITEAGGRFALVAPSQPARRTLEIAAIDRVVPVFETLAEAITSFA